MSLMHPASEIRQALDDTAFIARHRHIYESAATEIERIIQRLPDDVPTRRIPIARGLRAALGSALRQTERMVSEEVPPARVVHDFTRDAENRPYHGGYVEVWTDPWENETQGTVRGGSFLIACTLVAIAGGAFIWWLT